ncbi:abhydrolase domain-containing protein C22H12.03 [Caerostris darwini]|uniref:sn-1-specific diacylglycerol lipase ABHD11 n=1 Tax=Caerostris darwini TaxID=1538125 RepID=A0AAV4UWC9_9ARAC|nr:abhydrolase domain-containing protein C22H12.03 [Caerostris darwini]
MNGNLCGRFIQRLAKNLIKVKPQLPQCNQIITKRKCSSVVYPSSLPYRYTPVHFAYDLILPAKANDELPPLIFLHGINSAKEWCWGDLPQIIADRTERKAYSLDARNHGDSGWYEDFDFDLNVEDLLYFMDEHCIEKATIVGHSMGGLTGYRASVKAPERFEMLIVEEMYAKKVPQDVMDFLTVTSKLWIEAEECMPAGLEEEEAERFITEYVHSKNPSLVPKKKGPSGLTGLLRKDQSGRFVFKANLRVIQNKVSDIDSMMSEVDGVYEGPTYVIYGSRSPFEIYNHKENIQSHFPKAMFLEFQAVGHYVHKKYPKEFTEKVVKFILEQTEK